LLQALNTGHSGSISTIHANSDELSLARLASCVLQSGVDLPYQAIRRLISESIDLVLHLERHRGARRVSDVIRVIGYRAEADAFDIENTRDDKSRLSATS
jgi:pilus assembly protein CpaF